MASNTPRTVIVTGANKGIGYYIIAALLEGATPYNIILTARNQENGDKAITQLQSTYPQSISKLSFKQLDIDNTQSIDSFADWVKTELGTFDVLVDNAGIFGTSETKVDVLRTNFINTVLLTEKLLPYLAVDGKVITISSTWGSLKFQGTKARQLLEDPSLTTEKLLDNANRLSQTYAQGKTDEEFEVSQLTYATTKAYLNAYVRYALPKKVRPQQQVYTVCPGWCKTDMGGSDALKSAEEGADTAVYLINLPFKVDNDINAKFIRERQVIRWDDENLPAELLKLVQ